MGAAAKPKPVCLIAAICYSNETLKQRSIDCLEKKYGAIDFELAPVLFSYTNYYAKEMGASLKKIYISFCTPIDPGILPSIKHFTNSIESEYAESGSRTVNIDPGYIETPKLILATTKNFSHRIYIGDSIYGDVQLIWQNGRFNVNPWTYPDYADDKVRHFFENVRNNYFHKLKRA